MIHVGHVKEKIRNGDKTKTIYYTYPDVKTEADGWVNPEKYLPADFDLVWLQTEKGKTYPGWYAGAGWDGRQYDRTDRIVRWKRKEL